MTLMHKDESAIIRYHLINDSFQSFTVLHFHVCFFKRLMINYQLALKLFDNFPCRQKLWSCKLMLPPNGKKGLEVKCCCCCCCNVHIVTPRCGLFR